LIVQHPAGSVEVAVGKLRRRSLTISFSLLAILAGSMALIFSAARRAERLANVQMEFVTGVSHELCTPLAVINSAAENLADGVVDNPSQMQAYGGMIRDQSRRLERLVDQVLLFAAQRAGRSGFELRPIEIAQTLTQSLMLSEPILRDAGFDVEKEIGADLPMVLADPAAIGKCMENLFSNAMKYASANRWIAVRARMVATMPNPEVQVSVEDKGIGIPTRDLPNIFEPFYRVQAARDGQIRGVGLGLYLVKHMMEEMGGRVTVTSEPGRGSFFVLHFPVSEPVER
jgi:signal transduction histidine kinase